MSRSCWVLVAAAAVSVAGCSGAREVAVEGEVVDSTGAALQGIVVVQFHDLKGEGDEVEQALVHTKVLDGVGAFDETIEIEGDRVLVRAFRDMNLDGACTDGELWGEAESPVEETDVVEGLRIDLASAPCPKE
jgi:hypothetical protein